MSLKFTGELYVMAMKNDARTEEEPTCQLKIDIVTWRILASVLENFKNLHFNGLLMFELKKYTGVKFDCDQDWHKVWRKIGLCSQK